MGDVLNILLLQNTLRTATPVVLAALGCLMTQHVNITNIGIEGMMLTGAFFAVLGSYFAGSWVAGVACALLVGLLICWKGGWGQVPATWRGGLLAGSLFGLEFFFISEGLQLTSAAHMSVFLYTAPIFTAAATLPSLFIFL